jgi:murein DD-endopeptidase MepM/ murein hydrolase activator NlpD
MKNKQKRRSISFLLMSDTGAHNISLTLNIWVVRVLAVLIILVIVAMTLFVVYHARISQRFLFVSSLVKENADLKEKNRKIEVLYTEIGKIKAYERKIRLLTMNSEEKTDSTGTVGTEALEARNDVVPEKELDLFVQNIRLQRNLSFINMKDGNEKRKRIIESTPNILPVDGWISRGYTESNNKTGKDHTGIDIAAAYNSPIKASGPGIVTFSGWKPDFGNIVEIDHGYGFVSRYGHCSRISVKKGDLVERSQTVAFVGSSGRSSAPHLHFEIVKDGQRVDPLIFIIK